jgi:hypothetical protein
VVSPVVNPVVDPLAKFTNKDKETLIPLANKNSTTTQATYTSPEDESSISVYKLSQDVDFDNGDPNTVAEFEETTERVSSTSVGRIST